MKKLFWLVAATAFSFGSPVSADAFYGFFLGGGIWQSDYSGHVGEPSIGLKDLGFKDSNNGYYFLVIEHPIPFAPNVQLGRTNISSDQSALIQQEFALDEVIFSVDAEVQTDFDLSHTDLTLYYQLLDNWFNFDVGINLRHFDGHAQASSEDQSESVKLDEILPLLYVRAQFDLPLTGFALGASGKGISYSDNRLTETDIYLRYTLDSVMDVAFDLGYRSMDLKLDEKNIRANAKLAGPYVGMLLHF